MLQCNMLYMIAVNLAVKAKLLQCTKLSLLRLDHLKGLCKQGLMRQSYGAGPKVAVRNAN